MTRAWGPWTREQFMDLVEVDASGCWRWLGRHLSNGYATVTLSRTEGKADTTAHRLAYRLFVGPIAADLDADHLCLNRWCVNPGHLEAVTHRENIRRMPGLFGQRARATECPKGHPYVARSDGRRRCVVCRDARRRELRAAA